MTKYEIILYWSAEDDAFIAEVPELPGCAADGDTRMAALENVETVSASGSKLPVNSAARFQNRGADSSSPELIFWKASRNGGSRYPRHPSAAHIVTTISVHRYPVVLSTTASPRCGEARGAFCLSWLGKTLRTWRVGTQCP